MLFDFLFLKSDMTACMSRYWVHVAMSTSTSNLRGVIQGLWIPQGHYCGIFDVFAGAIELLSDMLVNWKAGLLTCWSFSSRSHSHTSRKRHHRPLNGERGNHAFISCQSGFVDLKWSPIIVVLLLLNNTIFQSRVYVCVCFLHFLFFMNAFFVAFHHFHSSTF